MIRPRATSSRPLSVKCQVCGLYVVSSKLAKHSTSHVTDYVVSTRKNNQIGKAATMSLRRKPTWQFGQLNMDNLRKYQEAEMFHIKAKQERDELEKRDGVLLNSPASTDISEEDSDLSEESLMKDSEVSLDDVPHELDEYARTVQQRRKNSLPSYRILQELTKSRSYEPRRGPVKRSKSIPHSTDELAKIKWALRNKSVQEHKEFLNDMLSDLDQLMVGVTKPRQSTVVLSEARTLRRNEIRRENSQNANDVSKLLASRKLRRTHKVYDLKAAANPTRDTAFEGPESPDDTSVIIAPYVTQSTNSSVDLGSSPSSSQDEEVETVEICEGCGEDIETRYERYLEASGYAYHLNCFKCEICGDNLRADQPYWADNESIDSNGSLGKGTIMCQRDYNYLLLRKKNMI
jgi:hypothetical protein